MRSILEARYDAWLHWRKIEHRHEVPVLDGRYIADVVLEDDTIVEIAGMIGYARYATKCRLKRAAYAEAGIAVRWLTATDVDKLFQQGHLELRFRVERRCAECDLATHDLVRGRCRTCYMRRWHLENAVESICRQCGVGYQRAGVGTGFCSRGCYWSSLELEWPPWSVIDALLQENSVADVARRLGVKSDTLNMRVHRRRKRLAASDRCSSTPSGTRACRRT